MKISYPILIGAMACCSALGTSQEARAAVQDVTYPGDVTNLVPLNSNPPEGEGVQNAIDNTTSKYLNFAGPGAGLRVTPSAGAPDGTIVTGLRIFTADDAIERDPASYKIEGSLTGARDDFSLIAQGALSLPETRNASGVSITTPGLAQQTVTFSNTLRYKHYRVTFPTLRNAAEANSVQVGEIELLGDLPLMVDVFDDEVAPGSTADFLVSLSAPASAEVRVPYATANGTATAGSDYTATSGTLVFAEGEREKTVSVPVLANPGNEPEENFFLNVTGPAGVTVRDGQGEAIIQGVLRVTNLNNDGSGSLRRAVNRAIRGSTILFADSLSGSIYLQSGELVVNKDLTIRGPGNDRIILDGQDATRILRVNGVRLNVSGLTFARGLAVGLEARGGAIRNDAGTLNVRNCVFRDNRTEAVMDFGSMSQGGAIFNDNGNLTIKTCSFERNDASVSAYASGGAVGAVGGLVSIEDSRFANNAVFGLFAANGAAVAGENTEETRIYNCVFQGNFAENVGGAVYVTNTFGDIHQCLFERNLAASGGAIMTYFAGLHLADSVLRSNSASSDDFSAGGALYALDSDVEIERCRIKDNAAFGPDSETGAGGAIYHYSSESDFEEWYLEIYDSLIQNNLSSSWGGGVAVHNRGVPTNFYAAGTTFSLNSADAWGGGVALYSESGPILADIWNSTLSGNVNVADSGSGGLEARGDSATELTLTACTITANDSSNSGGLRFEGNVSVRLENSIVAANSGPQILTGGLATVESGGFNLLDDSSLAGATSTDLLNTQPGLLPLANNGGFAPTHALADDSPALDKGNSFGLSTDQRGLQRPYNIIGIPSASGGDGSDIGAFERQKQVSRPLKSSKTF